MLRLSQNKVPIMELQVIENPYRTQASELAYRYAVDVLRGEFQTDDPVELATVAGEYAREFWPDWIPEALAMSRPWG